ncbi:hypothetical protein L3X38_013010 [Prunus dulcis]|uniref:Cyclin n=1 Tax=Prunus dulcis TaxID=3755 RepID=A0AAD4WL61_PRUDU|nr:cyclin-U2-1-like isoform X2 [Prunus dulcis]KAI5345133.1 hypothetical protein L3X38_013010 [Prunus dulcis]
MVSSSTSTSLIISPRKLRSDLYSYSYQEDSTTPLVVNVLASLIERSMARNQRIAKSCSSPWYMSKDMKKTRIFECHETLDMTIQSYLERIFRLLITTIMVASKYVEDMNYRNSYFARVGGLTTNELNKLELEFLFLMGFKLHVNVSVFESYCCHLEREVSIGGGYHIESTLRCAEEIKTRQNEERRYNQFAGLLL